MKMKMIKDSDLTHLTWMYNRMIDIHKENPNVDYMLKFKSIIDNFDEIVTKKTVLRADNYYICKFHNKSFFFKFKKIDEEYIYMSGYRNNKGKWVDRNEKIMPFLLSYIEEISEREAKEDKKLSGYLVRPRDFHIWEIDESNGCYRSYTSRNITDPYGNRQNADDSYTFENLTENYDFFPISESEIPKYELKNERYHEFVSWTNRNDGHGGSKGGTLKEFNKRMGYEQNSNR